MPTLLAVDGNSLAHRAYHALVREQLPGDWLTGGVVQMLASAWRQGGIESPAGAGAGYDGIVVAFDSPHNRRKEQFPGYKAHRPDKDPELTRQLGRCREGLAACGFTIAEVHGAEADDLLAAAADACDERGWRCDVLSSDRDLVALVSDTVRLLRPRRSMADLHVLDPAAVRAEYGVAPWQYTDLAALRGDPSDGLDGVRGIGPKTAARLLRDYGHVPGIYAVLPNLPTRLERALRAGRDNVERNLMLMAPIPGLSVNVDDAVDGGVDLATVEQALGRLGLADAADSLRFAMRRRPLPPLPPPPTDDPTEVVDARTPAVPTSAARGISQPVPARDGVQTSLF